MYYLNHTDLNLYINGATRGKLTKSSLESIQVPLPPLPQQQKIANILDAADALRQNDKALIAKYDELTQALFLDMFGDPVSNPKGWKLKEGSKYYEVRGRVGWKGYKKTDLRQSGAIVLGATHINNLGTIDLSKVVFLSQEKYIESPEIMVQKYDLIFVQRGNTIGKIALVRDELGEATINPVVLIFRPINANPFFLLYLLMNKGLNREFVGSNSGSAQPMITQKTMKDFLMIDVPLSLQNQFAERVAVIEEQKAIAQKSLEQSESLFNSLLQKAFKGELV
jgi:type I restriction enzyme S subunit